MLPEKIAGFIGKAAEIRVFEVGKGAIRKYADAVGETNPLYWDEEYARQAGYDSVVAPPGFFGWPSKWDHAMPFFEPLTSELMAAMADEGYPRILDGGIDYELFRPVVAGDVLAALMKVADVKVKEGKAGKMLLYSFETTYVNQRGDLVAKVMKNAIAR